jgi:hypothetical protein
MLSVPKKDRKLSAIVKKKKKSAADERYRVSRPTGFQGKGAAFAIKGGDHTVEDYGLSPARADDLVFLEVFYCKHGYAKVNVHYVIESQNRCALIHGRPTTLGKVS